MKPLIAFALILAASAGVQAAGKQTPAQLQAAQQAQYEAARKALPQPPPYGAYFIDDMGDRSGKTTQEAKQAIAQHYGYKSAEDARLACVKALNRWQCNADIVAHRRHEASEIKKYGFKNWKDAVNACVGKRVRDYGPVNYCEADPFLELRPKK
jgi:hypothetical protein